MTRDEADGRACLHYLHVTRQDDAVVTYLCYVEGRLSCFAPLDCGLGSRHHLIRWPPVQAPRGADFTPNGFDVNLIHHLDRRNVNNLDHGFCDVLLRPSAFLRLFVRVVGLPLDPLHLGHSISKLRPLRQMRRLEHPPSLVPLVTISDHLCALPGPHATISTLFS